MKKLKVTLLSLATLCLVGCGTRNDASSPVVSDSSVSAPASESEQVISNKPISVANDSKDDVSSKDSASSVASDSEKDSSSVNAGGDGDKESTAGPSSTVSSDSSSSIDYANAGWNRSVVDDMVQYLNGNILPYVKIAQNNKDIISEYESSTKRLIISGDDYDTSYISLGKTAFDNAGWDTTGSSSSVMKAKLTSAHLTVEMKTGETGYNSSVEGLICIYAKWDETFDPTSFTAWPQDVLDLFDAHLNGNVIPLVYLSTKNPTGEFSTYGKKITITGGDWNSQVLGLAASAFTADGWTVSAITSSVTATKTMPDGWSIKAVVDSTSSSYAPKAEMIITWNEPFILPPAGTTWDQTVLDAFDADFLGIQIPYIYLGTMNPTTQKYASLKELDIKGSDWNDGIRTEAQNIFSAANGWSNIVDGDCSTSTNAYVAYKDFVSPQDNETYSVHIKLYKNSSGLALLECYYTKAYVVPVGGDWSADTKQDFVDYLGGHELPYFYIGADTSSWNTSGKYLQIDGDCWDPSILTTSATVFTADGWTVTTEPEASYSYSDITKAVKTFSDGTKLTVEVFKYLYSNSTPRIRVTPVLPYVVPAGVTDWNQDVLDAFTQHFGGTHVPFVYLGTTAATVSWSSYSNKLSIKGGAWNDAMLTSATTAFSNAGWGTGTTVTNSHSTSYGNYSEDEFKLTYTAPSSESFDISLYGNTSSDAVMEITYTGAYDPTTATAWTQDIEDEMTTNLGRVLPFVYLGTASPTATWRSLSWYSALIITGDVWNDAIYTDALAAYPASDGWEATQLDSVLLLVKVDSATNEMFTIRIEQTSNKATMSIYYSEAYAVPAPSATDAWPTDLSDLFTAHTNGNAVPYFYLGSTSFTASYKTDGYIDYVADGKDWHDQYIVNAKAVLEADGFTCTYDSAMSDGSLHLIAEKVCDGGSATMTVHVLENYSDKAEMKVYYKSSYNKPADGDWTDAIKTKISSYCSGFELPYIYLGASSDALTTSAYTSEYDIKGGTWDARIYQDAIDSLTADANNTWQYCYDYSSSATEPTLIASTIYGTKHITLKLKKNTSDLPLLEIYFK